jgi:cysteinyl-tRNA synthetase
MSNEYMLIEILSDIRQNFREKEDWALADEIRNRMKKLDIVLEDVKVGIGKQP